MKNKRMKILVTGGSGFLGSLLIERLLGQGYGVVNIDLMPSRLSHPRLVSVQGDIRNEKLLSRLSGEHAFEIIFHCAAVLAHGNYDRGFLWTSNVEGTRNIAECAKKNDVAQVVFISSNCLWGRNMHKLVSETDIPEPVELYGWSKWEGEKILWAGRDCFNVVIFRSPTIIDAGRLGLLAILFEFIKEGRKVWVVGSGNNVYQFIYAQDLIDAAVSLIQSPRSGIYNIGSDNVKSLREVYGAVIKEADSGARVSSLPAGLVLPVMKVVYRLHLSPLGTYHYKMIMEDFVFNTDKIKMDFKWRLTLSNRNKITSLFLIRTTMRLETIIPFPMPIFWMVV